MNKKQYINKLCVLFFLMFFTFFSCDNEKEVENSHGITPFELEIDSVNASEFAKSFVADIDESRNAIKYQNGIYGDSSNVCLIPPELSDSLFRFFSVEEKLLVHISNGVDLKYVGYKEKKGSHFVYIRLFSPPVEIGYLELQLSAKNNKIELVDYSFPSEYGKGSTMQQEIYSLICLNQYSVKQLYNELSIIDAMVKSFYKMDLEKVDSLYYCVSPKIRNTAYFKSKEFNMLLHSGEEKRNKALVIKSLNEEKYSLNYWNNYFYLYLSNKEYESAIGSLNLIREALFDEISLTYLEAMIYFEKREYDKAVGFYNQVLSKEPDVPNFHFAKVICLVEMKEYVKAVESLLVMEDYFDVININWDKEFMAYPEFLISDEYSKWLERVEAIEGDPI